jgi:hypothetical protein
MKLPAYPSLAISFIIMSSVLPGSAQVIEMLCQNSSRPKFENLGSADHPSFASDKFLSGVYQLPEIQKSRADLSESAPLFVSQDALTLSAVNRSARRIENILDLSVLRETSAYRNAGRIKLEVSDAQTSGIHSGLAELSAAYQRPGQQSSADCPSVAMSVEQRIKLDPSKVLEIVESEISANTNCACEIVKIAIKSSGADVSLVGDITEVAITAAPDSMRMISQCAIATMPEALSAVQAVLAKFDPNGGESNPNDAKSGKDAKATIASAVAPPVKPPPPLYPPLPPLPPPPVFPPPEVTDPNP